jgi:hypothetical protein
MKKTKAYESGAVSPVLLQTERVAQAIALARQAREHAYVPYSKFRMGAAVGTDKGVLLSGTVVENVSLENLEQKGDERWTLKTRQSRSFEWALKLGVWRQILN